MDFLKKLSQLKSKNNLYIDCLAQQIPSKLNNMFDGILSPDWGESGFIKNSKVILHYIKLNDSINPIKEDFVQKNEIMIDHKDINEITVKKKAI